MSSYIVSGEILYSDKILNNSESSAQHDPDTEKRPDCTPEDKNINGRFLMSKVSEAEAISKI